jgi:hypothetical protein
MSFRLSVRAVAVAIAAIGFAHPLLAQASSNHRLASGVRMRPNRVKYSDAGSKPATGRSGSASLESRALVAKDGTTLIEASTGSLDGGTSPGVIRKMQMKVLSADGKPLSVQNFNAGSANGYWSTSFRGLGRNQKIQLQASVGGIDGQRTDVVTVDVRVERRPDIALDGLTVPAKALAGARVNVVAVVAEKNGDVGARTTCMLSLDGALIDQARGIWVDAGQSVSCAFQTNVAAVGVHQLSVYTTGVSPADWDPTNNGASASIEIVSPESPLGYTASFLSKDYDYRTHQKASSEDGTYVDETTANGVRQERTLSLSSSISTDAFSFPVRVRSALSTAGSSVFDLTNDIALSPDASWPGADCGDLVLGKVYVSVCNNHFNGVTRSQVDLTSFDSRVTYFGSHFLQTDGTDGYVENSSSDNSMGRGAYAVGPDVSPLLELTDARGMKFAARPTITLVSSPIDERWTNCTQSFWNGVTTCYDGSNTGTTRTGAATGGPQ